MPLQCDICEGIQIVPMLLDVLTLRRNEFRDPRFRAQESMSFRMVTLHRPCQDIGRMVLLCRLGIQPT